MAPPLVQDLGDQIDCEGDVQDAADQKDDPQVIPVSFEFGRQGRELDKTIEITKKNLVKVVAYNSSRDADPPSHTKPIIYPGRPDTCSLVHFV